VVARSGMRHQGTKCKAIPISLGVTSERNQSPVWPPFQKKLAKSRRISWKPAYIPVAAPFGRCDRAQGLFGDLCCETLGVDAPGLIQGD